MKNKKLWEAMLKYLGAQVHTERTPRTAAMEPVKVTMCDECRAIIPEQGHFAECETGQLIATIRRQLGGW